MAPKRQLCSKLTLAEQAANYHRRARELQLKAEKKQLELLLAKAPHLAGVLLQHARDLGYSTENMGALPMVVSESPSIQKASRMERVDKMKANQAEESAAGGGDSLVACPVSEIVPSKYWTLGTLSVAMLTKNLLCVMEPVALSVANIRSMSLRGQGEHGKTELLKILEFCTGLHPDTPINGNLRKWCELQKLVKDLNDRYGRRAREVTLPPCWDSHGVYSVHVHPGGINVLQRFTGQNHLIRDELLMSDPESWSLHCNWSDCKAVLQCDDTSCSTVKPIALQPLFNQVVSQGAPHFGKGVHHLGGEPHKDAGNLLAIGDGAANSSSGASENAPEHSPKKLRKEVEMEDAKSHTSEPSASTGVASVVDESCMIPPPPEGVAAEV